MLEPDDIPDDYEVRPIPDDASTPGLTTCGTCGLSWDDSIITSMTPAPSARCPFEYFHEEYEPDIWALLEQPAPQGCEAIQDLYSWSLNYDPGKGPMTLLLDLIGYSTDNYGETLYNLADASLGYLELDKLAKALSEYADRPHDVLAYVETLLEAEAR